MPRGVVLGHELGPEGVGDGLRGQLRLGRQDVVDGEGDARLVAHRLEGLGGRWTNVRCDGGLRTTTAKVHNTDNGDDDDKR